MDKPSRKKVLILSIYLGIIFLTFQSIISLNASASSGLFNDNSLLTIFLPEDVPHTLSEPVVLFPNGGEIVNGTINIRWVPANDSLNHTIYYDVFYTLGGITGWTPVFGGTNITQTSFNWSTISIHYAFYVKIRIVADDMMGLTTQDESDSDFDIINIEQQVSEPTILSPNGGETLSNISSITWTPSESTLSYTIFYNVYYSYDDGSSWISLITDTTNTSFDWNTSSVENGSNYLIKVIASDSHGMFTEDQSNDTFSIQNVDLTNTQTTTITNTKDSSLSETTTSSKLSSGFTLLSFLFLVPLIICQKAKRRVLR